MKLSINNQYTSINNRPVQRHSSPYVNFKGANVVEAQKSKIFKPIEDTYQKASAPFKKFYDKHILEPLAKYTAKILESGSFVSFYKWAQDKNMIPHLLCLTSIILSGFYIQQTLTNKKLDDTKKKTLAINQAAVAGLSALMGYTVDAKASKYIQKFADRFTAVNAKNQRLGVYLAGLNDAKSIVIFGMIYRFIAPVLVTPIANHIGNKINEKKEAKEQTKLA